MAVIDCFLYNGEREILDLHLNTLDQYVDRFVIVEAKTTFSGYHKPLYFSEHEHLFRKFWPKIHYHIVNESYSIADIELAQFSPNTIGAEHWKNEFLQKESIQKALIRYKAQDSDTVYIGDVDEIWMPYAGTLPAKLKLKVFAYYLDNESNEEFWGTFVAQYKDIKGKVLNHLRTEPSYRTENVWGWHFTSMGGYKEVSRKLNDSYTQESYNTYEVQAKLPDRLRDGIDYLGRPFIFHGSEEWPLYLTRNIKKYQHLLKEKGKTPQYSGSEEEHDSPYKTKS